MENVKPKPAPSPRFEVLTLSIGMAAFLLINIFSAERSPAAWCDEVMYADPAVNLYQGHGFVSGAWYAQTLDKYWAGNVPLFQFVLFGWLKLFGFSIVSVRTFHYVLVCAAAWVAWAAIRRLNLIPSASQRLLFCLMAALCSASTFVYRSARPESLCLLLMALGLWALCVQTRALRLAWLALIGALLVWSGLQMAAYVGLLAVLVWVLGPKRFRLEMVVLCGGCALGLILLGWFYVRHGVWGDFVLSIRRHTIANQGVQHVVIPGYGSGLKEKLRRLPEIYRDYSFFPLLALALWLLWGRWRARSLDMSSPLVFGLAVMLIVPLGLDLVGVFPLYYFWMAFLPLALGVGAELSRERAGRGGGACWIVLLLITLVCVLGLPKRLIIASLDWRGRDYKPVMELAAPFVSGDRLVLSEFASYYAAKQSGATVILPPYLDVMTEKDKAELSVAIVHGGDVNSLARDFGGTWRDTGAALKPPVPRHLLRLRESLDSRQYDLHVFVREPLARR